MQHIKGAVQIDEFLTITQVKFQEQVDATVDHRQPGVFLQIQFLALSGGASKVYEIRILSPVKLRNLPVIKG